LEKFETLTEKERKLASGKLLSDANQEDNMRIEINRLLQVNDTPITAVRLLLDFFGQTFARQSFVIRVLQSSEILWTKFRGISYIFFLVLIMLAEN
jgi:hypothetical protein